LPDVPLIVFGSIAGVWGSAGQAAYASANAAVDALVTRRRAEGRPATSIAWGPWARVGMAADDEVADRLRRRGLAPMAPERALDALAVAVAADEGLITVADVDWERFVPVFSAARARPLFAGLATDRPSTVPAGDDLAARLSGVDAAERDRLLLRLVRDEVAGVLGHTSGASVAPGRAFRELGFDSLTAVQLRDRLIAATGVPFSPTLVFDYPNAERLAAHLAETLAPAAAPLVELTDHQIRAALAAVPVERLRESGLLAQLLDLAPPATGPQPAADLDAMNADDLVRLALGNPS
jgi:hypothetical protein